MSSARAVSLMAVMQKRKLHKRKSRVQPFADNSIQTDSKDEEATAGVCWRQNAIRRKYESNLVQVLVALLIFSNFLVSAVEAQLLPEPDSDLETVFVIFEWFFGIIFALELLWNLYGSWWTPFWSSGWNIFDFVIVVISLLSLAFKDLPGISVLRLFRAFRVFRLFKRVPSLRTIIEGVVASLPGVSNAFVVVVLLMGIWSIMGVEFYGDFAPQYFGNFFKAMFTMWQVMTMDSWASGVGRKLIFEDNIWMASVFFVSFTFICGIIMTNVVVAILLEKYLEATNKSKERKAAAGGSPKTSPTRSTDTDTKHGPGEGADLSGNQYLHLVLQRLDTLTDEVRVLKQQLKSQPQHPRFQQKDLSFCISPSLIADMQKSPSIEQHAVVPLSMV